MLIIPLIKQNTNFHELKGFEGFRKAGEHQIIPGFIFASMLNLFGLAQGRTRISAN